MRLCAVSVDLDEIPNYYAIHGMETPKTVASAVYDVALDRLFDLSRDARVPLTLFAIGRDLDRPEAAARLRDANALGHEIANHSLDHWYDLTRRPREEIRAQILGGIRAIERAVGVTPVGFRAPGYTITDTVFEILQELGVQYDSSVFPCPSYWAPKALAIGMYALRGKTSSSVVDNPSVLLAPTSPYLVGKPYWKRGQGILELPIQVTRGLRLPFIGTSVTLAGPERASWLAKMCVGEPLINLELHGMDVLEANDGLQALRPHQIDLRVSLADKLASLHAVIDVLRAKGYAFVTMREAARELV
jgi:peptidoglycan-N-acetylglucosamine deacetylase